MTLIIYKLNIQNYFYQQLSKNHIYTKKPRHPVKGILKMPKAGFPKLCNYCKNHTKSSEPPVLEKHHRPCEKYNNKEHLEICKPCRQNHRKTENVRKWRANKLNKKPADKEIEIIFEELLKGKCLKSDQKIFFFIFCIFCR